MKKKITAALTALALIGGALPMGSASLFGSPGIAKADTIAANENDADHLSKFDPASFSEKTGVLTICGKVNKEDIRKYYDNEKVKKVFCAKGTVFPSDCSFMFESFKAESIDLSNADTSNVTDMSDMFCECGNLSSVDVSSFDTSNVTNMHWMFGWCHKLTSIDVSSFDTSKVKDFRRMFTCCENLASIDVTGFDTSSAEKTFQMFYGCDKLEADIVHVDGTSLTLDGRIGVLFNILEKGYLHNEEESVSSSNLAKIVMSGPNGDVVITDFSAKTAENPEGINICHGRMKCVYPLNATQAKEKVTVKAYDKNGKQLILCPYYDWSTNNDKTYYSLYSRCEAASSINYYLQNVEHDSSYKNDSKLQILVNSIDNYCKTAENYFCNAENTVNEYSDAYAATVDSFAPKFGDDIRISLVLDSENAARIYTNGSVVKSAEKTVITRKTKYGDCFEISNIPAHKLIKYFTLNIDGTDYQFSPISYVYRVVNNKKASKELKDAAWAAFMYAAAANAYVKE